MSGKRVDPVHGREIAEAYASGASFSALIAKYGYSRAALRRAVLKRGGVIRRRGNRVRSFSAKQVAKMLKLWRAGCSQTEIASHFDTAQTVISRVFRLHGVTVEHRRPRGERHGNWNGGRHALRNGYVWVLVPPDSPYAAMRNTGGYVFEHRLVVAQSLGRPLRPDESVHHLNGDRKDNRPENLQLRKGQHGKHAAFCCADCGSRNVIPIKLA